MPSIDHASSPQIAADASEVWVVAFSSVNFFEAGWTARRFFDVGAQTTRQLIEQLSGTLHVLPTVNCTASSPLSC